MAKSDKKRQREADEVSLENGTSNNNASTDNSSSNPQPPAKKARFDTHRQLFVRSLAPEVTSEDLTNFFSQHYPVKHATVVLDVPRLWLRLVRRPRGCPRGQGEAEQ
jgi:nucleolar protein 4